MDVSTNQVWLQTKNMQKSHEFTICLKIVPGYNPIRYCIVGCHVLPFSTDVLKCEFQSTSDLHCAEDQLYHQRLRFPVALPHLRRVAGALRFAGCTAACRGGSRSRSAAGFRKFSSYVGWIKTSMAGVLPNKMCLNHNYSAGDLSLFHHSIYMGQWRNLLNSSTFRYVQKHAWKKSTQCHTQRWFFDLRVSFPSE